MHFTVLRIAACAVPAALLSWAALAQSNGCDAVTLADPPRTTLTCPNGVVITAEDGTIFSLEDRNPAAGPEAVRLDGKALLLEVPEGNADGFETVTPQAIAAVRGTRWAVDVADGKTAVFVLEGRVIVSRPAGSPAVTLGPGEGVDVAPGTEPLTVRRWGAPRVAALLARFGE
jgi:ferric-dicitrate binding protein FerR (iron transport regulator)